MAANPEATASGCPLDDLLKMLGRQWTPHILWQLSQQGPMRFGTLRRNLGGVSAKVLTERLRALEGADVLYREQAATIPPQVTYGLKPRGRELAGVLAGLDQVAARWHAHSADAR
jgi:DNA-binding HxlR family transcriptional regulator